MFHVEHWHRRPGGRRLDSSRMRSTGAGVKVADELRELVNARGRQLREIPFDELRKLPRESSEVLRLNSRTGGIETVVEPFGIHGMIVDPPPAAGIRVVVLGVLPARWFRLILDVAADGFYKYPDESISEFFALGVAGRHVR